MYMSGDYIQELWSGEIANTEYGYIVVVVYLCGLGLLLILFPIQLNNYRGSCKFTELILLTTTIIISINLYCIISILRTRVCGYIGLTRASAARALYKERYHF